MPPKRAKTAAKPATTRPAPRTRTTRSKTTANDAPSKDTSEAEESAELVRLNTRNTRTRTSVAEDDVVMSGGLGEGEASTTRTRRATTSKSGPSGSDEAEVAEPKTVRNPMQRGRRAPRTVKKTAQSEANQAALEGLKKRMEDDTRRLKEGDAPVPAGAATEGEVQLEAESNIAAAAEVAAAPGLPPTNISPPTSRTRAAPRATQKGLPSSAQRKAPRTIQLGSPDSAQKPAPGSVARQQSTVKVQSTPGAENSVLALANFRRRARQPSLLQMVQNPDFAKDAGEDSTDLTADFTLDASDDEEEEDFNPQDESTPLQVSRGALLSNLPNRSQAGTPARPTAVPVEDDADSLYNATPLPSPHAKSSRKRKSDALDEVEGVSHLDIQIPRSQPSPSRRRSSSQLPLSSSIPASPNLDGIVPATAPTRSATPSPRRSQISSTYASPMSSSIIASPVSASKLSQDRPPVSAQQVATSPTKARRPARNAPNSRPKADDKVLKTATLRALLPKRRRQLVAADREREKERNEYDISTSSFSSSIEEISEPDVATRRRNPKAKGVLSPVVKKKQPLRKNAVGGPAMGKKQETQKQQQAKKTYSRAVTVGSSSSDKENESETYRDNILARGETSELSELESAAAAAAESESPPDTSIETIRGGEVRYVSKELKERKKFFDEVDEWDMEFESMSGGGMGSSPAWR